MPDEDTNVSDYKKFLKRYPNELAPCKFSNVKDIEANRVKLTEVLDPLSNTPFENLTDSDTRKLDLLQEAISAHLQGILDYFQNNGEKNIGNGHSDLGKQYNAFARKFQEWLNQDEQDDQEGQNQSNDEEDEDEKIRKAIKYLEDKLETFRECQKQIEAKKTTPKATGTRAERLNFTPNMNSDHSTTSVVHLEPYKASIAENVPNFTGQVLDFELFMDHFESVIHYTTARTAIKMQELMKRLPEDLFCRFLGLGDSKYEYVLSELKKMFNNPYVIQKACNECVSKLKPVKSCQDIPELRKLFSEFSKCVHILHRDERNHNYMNYSLFGKISALFPYEMIQTCLKKQPPLDQDLMQLFKDVLKEIDGHERQCTTTGIIPFDY